MAARKWNEKEMATLEAFLELGTHTAEIAKRLNRSKKAVERKIESLGLSRPNLPDPVPEHVTDAEHWESEFKRVCRELTKERKRNKAVNVLVEDIKTHAPTSYKTAPPVRWEKFTHGKSQSAVLLLSDTHVGQVVEPEQTQGFGEYSFPTFLRRLKRLENTIYSILNEHVNTNVDELVAPRFA
jgi:hypothetical protein